MKRIVCKPRDNWPGIVEGQGFPFHSYGQRPTQDVGTYWYEEAYYEFTSAEVDVLEAATEELHSLCRVAMQSIEADPEYAARYFKRLGLAESYIPMIMESWKRQDPTLYGRFDLAYDGINPPKMLEYNADTPTTLIETSIVQWFWLKDMEETIGTADQFNSVHEKILDRWRAIKAMGLGDRTVYFSAVKENIEEFATVEYIRDLAEQAGVNTRFIYMEDLGWDARSNSFVDMELAPLQFWFKLYPWEWLAQEQFGACVPLAQRNMGILEPPWKMLLSNKGILPVLWDMFPEHPNLLPAYWEPRSMTDYVSKPLCGREGKNIGMVNTINNTSTLNDGPYGSETRIYQQRIELPKFDGQYVVLGSWIIGDQAAGMCVREDENPIIVNRSRVVPHVFK